MAENVDNLIIAQLRAIRDDIRKLDGKIDEVNENLTTRIDALQGITIGPGHYVHALDDRIGALEEKIGT
jgi:hypothetical protein